MAEKTIRPGVNHIVPDGREVDHSSVLVTGDHQVGDQSHLVSVERSAVNLVSP